MSDELLMKEEAEYPQDWAMCIDCDWQGESHEVDTDIDEDEFWGRPLTYPICPECGGGIELTSKEHGDYNGD